MRYCSVLVPLHVDALVASSASLEVGTGADLHSVFFTDSEWVLVMEAAISWCSVNVTILENSKTANSDLR